MDASVKYSGNAGVYKQQGTGWMALANKGFVYITRGDNDAQARLFVQDLDSQQARVNENIPYDAEIKKQNEVFLNIRMSPENLYGISFPSPEEAAKFENAFVMFSKPPSRSHSTEDDDSKKDHNANKEILALRNELAALQTQLEHYIDQRVDQMKQEIIEKLGK